ncbi:MAG: hypothetical protein ABEI99_09215 [Halobaculum sp.]
MDPDAFGEDAWDAFTDRLRSDDVSGVVTVVETRDPFDSATFDVWAKSGERAVEAGVDRWAVVGDRIKRMSTRSQLDVPGLEVEGFEDRSEALEWTRAVEDR